MSREQEDTKQKTLLTEAELDSAIKKARESGEIAARIEVGQWLEANLIHGPYRTVYSDIFPSMIKRLKEGKSL